LYQRTDETDIWDVEIHPQIHIKFMGVYKL